MDVSKIESGNFEITIEPTDLFFISEHVVELFSKKANEKHIKLLFNIDNKIPLCVQTDTVRLRQVLSNLLSNAIKFTPNKGVVSFNINLLRSEDGKSLIRFEVEDSGIGIPKDKISSIFNPFIQVDHKSNREFEGTGLGLSICTHIIESLGSKIDVKSEVGSGTKFWFELELNSCDNNFTTTRDYVNSLNFKIIDDDSEIFHYAKRYLNIFGTINDENREFDLVICCSDEKSNESLLNLREEYKNIPILVLYEYEEDLNSLELNSNEQALALPFYPSKLNDCIAELLQRSDKIIILKDSEFNEQYSGNVLIAEDNSANQELISHILDEMGINYTIKSNGEEVIKEYISNSYDLILMDINMPIMDGVEAFNKIREYEYVNSLKETPVIALTANAIKGDRERFLEIGMNNYLSKPINVDELKKIFNIYLEVLQSKPKIKEKISIDTKKISEKLGISENIAQMIIKKFNVDIKKDIKELEEFIKNKDDENIVLKAHYIKNSCLNLSLDEVCELLQQLEDKNLDKKSKESIFYEIKTKIDDYLE